MCGQCWAAGLTRHSRQVWSHTVIVSLTFLLTVVFPLLLSHGQPSSAPSGATRFLIRKTRTLGMHAGEVVLEPEGACRPGFGSENEVDSHVRLECQAADSASIITYLASDETCSGHVQLNTTQSLPIEVNGVRTECIQGAISGYLEEKTIAGSCGSPVCNARYLATGVCMGNEDVVTMGGVSFNSTYAWMNGTLA